MAKYGKNQHFGQFCWYHCMNSTKVWTLKFCIHYSFVLFFRFQQYIHEISSYKLANSKNNHFLANFLRSLHVKLWCEIAGTNHCRMTLKFWHGNFLMLDRILETTQSGFSKKVEIRPTLMYILFRTAYCCTFTRKLKIFCSIL